MSEQVARSIDEVSGGVEEWATKEVKESDVCNEAEVNIAAEQSKETEVEQQQDAKAEESKP